MKKIRTLLVLGILAISLFSIGIVSAEGELADSAEKFEMPNAGNINMFDRMLDNLAISMTFNQERKIERTLQTAEERFAEAEKLAERGDVKSAEKAKNRYQKLMRKTEKALDKIDSEDGEKSEEAVRKVARLQERVQLHQEKLSVTRNNFLEKHEDKLNEEEREKFEEMFTEIEKVSSEMEAKAKERQSEVERSHRELMEISETEFESLRKQIEEEEGIVAARTERITRENERFEEAMNIRLRDLEALADRYNVESSESGMTESEKIEALAEERRKYDEFMAKQTQYQEQKTAEMEAIRQRVEAQMNSMQNMMNSGANSPEQMLSMLRGFAEGLNAEGEAFRKLGEDAAKYKNADRATMRKMLIEDGFTPEEADMMLSNLDKM